MGSASSKFSKAEDMQELVRRLSDRAVGGVRSGVAAGAHPGAMLHRPDQTSRGAALEEPRVRFRPEAAFGALERRYGPFSEALRAERPLMVRQAKGGGVPRLWAHPTFDTVVATAMTRIGERLSVDSSTCPSG